MHIHIQVTEQVQLIDFISVLSRFQFDFNVRPFISDNSARSNKSNSIEMHKLTQSKITCGLFGAVFGSI